MVTEFPSHCSRCDRDVTVRLEVLGDKRGAVGRAAKCIKCPNCGASYRSLPPLPFCPKGHPYRVVKSGKHAGMRFCPACRGKRKPRPGRHRNPLNPRKPKVFFEFEGESHTIHEWAKLKGAVSPGLAWTRVKHGWDAWRAITLPPLPTSGPECGERFRKLHSGKKKTPEHIQKFREAKTLKRRKVIDFHRDFDPSIHPGRSWCIYTLSDPLTGDVRYVGWTTNPRVRLCSHVSAVRSGSETNTHKSNWIKRLMRTGLEPHLNIIEKGCGQNWPAREKFWINHFRAAGVALLNRTDGGEGVVGVVASVKTREKLRRAMTGRVFTEEWKQKISKAKKGVSSPAIRAQVARLIESARGRKEDPIHALARVASLRGRKRTPEMIEKTASANRGKKRTPEQCARMAEGHRRAKAGRAA